MELGERAAEHAVLEGRQYLIAHILVQWHAAFQRTESFHHPRAKYGIGFTVQEGFEKLREAFRGILAVSMDQCDDIELLLHCIVETKFLIPSIALIDRVEQHSHRER